jgi:transcriptional regulator with XRE-family HTH domain
MTARGQIRAGIGVDPSDAGRGLSVEPAPSLSERLHSARKRKGVDLYQAERETKIRAQYLGALERGDYGDLPGDVYTKGFLRNYALYLDVDPDEALSQWRRELGEGGPRGNRGIRGQARDTVPLIGAPRPIAEPRKGVAFSRGMVVVVLLAVVVVGFGAYLGIQILRFTKPPALSVSDPASAVLDVDASTTAYRLRGTTLPGAAVSIATPGRDPYRVTAGTAGDWSADVDLLRGRNQFDVSAVDPETGKRSESTIRLFITVPLLTTGAPTLTVDPPAGGATFEKGAH